LLETMNQKDIKPNGCSSLRSELNITKIRYCNRFFYTIRSDNVSKF